MAQAAAQGQQTVKGPGVGAPEEQPSKAPAAEPAARAPDGEATVPGAEARPVAGTAPAPDVAAPPGGACAALPAAAPARAPSLPGSLPGSTGEPAVPAAAAAPAGESAAAGSSERTAAPAGAGAESPEQSEEMLEAAASLGSLALPPLGSGLTPLSSMPPLNSMPPPPETHLHTFAAAASALFSQLAREGCVSLAARDGEEGAAPASTPPRPPALQQPATPPAPLEAAAHSLDLSPFFSRAALQAAPPGADAASAAAAAAAAAAAPPRPAPAGAGAAAAAAAAPAAAAPAATLPAPFPAAGSITNSPGAPRRVAESPAPAR